ncbi:nuclease-related domain-containing protein [Deinococcus planocerae]|uniref:nuclease-related domain-containing protein n=1 Tax=Deinococcus planocerae TaxID=1737569 RepID=UPI001FEAFA8C|nr:nuclease-related domain-containing protein [Deinococcus planocerae]
MIVKDLEPQTYSDPLRRAGYEAERQMTHYLKRAFGDDPHVWVWHNLRIERKGEAAQLDHLVMYRHGLIVVESKSVTGQVSINGQGEWTRWWKGEGRGMPSPILQARRQLDLLTRLLSEHTEKVLDRGLFGLTQRRFDPMRRDVLVAISDGGRVTRKAEVPEVVKADQVPRPHPGDHAGSGRPRRLRLERHRTRAPGHLLVGTSPIRGTDGGADGTDTPVPPGAGPRARPTQNLPGAAEPSAARPGHRLPLLRLGGRDGRVWKIRVLPQMPRLRREHPREGSLPLLRSAGATAQGRA